MGQKKANTVARHAPILLVLAHLVAAFLLTWLLPLPVTATPILRIAGFMLVIVGFILGMAALIPFRRSRMASPSRKSAGQLVTSGIYGVTRNPIYLGFVCMLAGLPLNAGSFWGIVLLPLLLILFNRLIIEHEENHLLQAFGDEFRRYKSKVRRWI